MLGALVMLAFLLGMGTLGQSTATGTASVQGIVLDADHKPLPGATAYAVIENDIRKQIHAKTDDEGRFTLTGIPPGGVFLDAFKADDGYPYNFFSFFIMPGEKMPRLTVEAGQTVTGAVIQLGARAAHLNILITEEDGSPLQSPGGQIVLTRPDVPHCGHYSKSIRPNESIMVPPVPFRLAVEVDGYQPWHYGGSHWRGAAGLITLKSGESLTLTVSLKKGKTGNFSASDQTPEPDCP